MILTDLLAEQVLLSVLEARPVDVADIRAAIAGLHAEPAPLPDHKEKNRIQSRILTLELIASTAAELLLANEAWRKSFDDDAIDMDGEYDKVQAAIEALAPLLAKLATA